MATGQSKYSDPGPRWCRLTSGCISRRGPGTKVLQAPHGPGAHQGAQQDQGEGQGAPGYTPRGVRRGDRTEYQHQPQQGDQGGTCQGDVLDGAGLSGFAGRLHAIIVAERPMRRFGQFFGRACLAIATHG